MTSVAVWLVYITTAGGTMATGDAVAMFEAARSMIDRGTLDVPASQSSELWRGVDGRYYTPFGIGQSLFDVPFVLAGRVAANARPASAWAIRTRFPKRLSPPRARFRLP